uniref:Uncharacterized protein n=1 Tax=Arion vulgaris TaxID=1028688 RepID=A0A0B6Y647_9EUPU
MQYKNIKIERKMGKVKEIISSMELQRNKINSVQLQAKLHTLPAEKQLNFSSDCNILQYKQ